MIIAGGTTMIIGTIILTSSTTIAQLLVGRIVTGIVRRCTPSLAQLHQLSVICLASNLH